MTDGPEVRERAATLSLPPEVEHVRTARLVAVATARRLGFDEARVDDVRLVLGELVSRAVLRQQAVGIDSDVLLVMRDGDGLTVEVSDTCPDGTAEIDGGVGLALVRAVAPHVELRPGTAVVRWPAPA